MSGHSKWHNIQGRKGKQDAVKSGVFTKLAKTITIAAQKGGDPATNFSLRLAIDKAKESSMPKDNIDRAVKRGTGELADEAKMEELLYEGFGPGNTAILVKAVTNNKNRTAPDIKHIFSKYGGNVGGPGSVQWMFGEWGVVEVGKEYLKNGRLEIEMQLIESGAEDIADEDEGILIKTKIENLQKVLVSLKKLKIDPLRSGIEWIPKDVITVNEADQERLAELFAALEEHDDIADYFTNAA
jgi:YebC/PmpR family DNA-binding regulatory protein